MNATFPPHVLSAAEYERALIAHLEARGVGAGMPPGFAAQVAAGRWPMSAESMREEIENRGLRLTLDDMRDFLRARFGREAFDDGSAIEAGGIGWPERFADALIAWAHAAGRGEPVEPSPGLTFPDWPAGTVPTLADMINLLKYGNMLERMLGGFTLARSVGAGLAIVAEGREEARAAAMADGEYISGIIGEAIAGVPGAAGRLERLVTTAHPAEAAEIRARVARN